MTPRPDLRRWLRFAVGGAVNTAASYGIYLLLHLVLPYQAAYLLAYAAGVLFAYWFNSVFVFHTPLAWRTLLTYPLVYAVQYLLSAALLAGAVEVLRLSPTLAPLLVAACMVPSSYLINKMALLRRARSVKP